MNGDRDLASRSDSNNGGALEWCFGQGAHQREFIDITPVLCFGNFFRGVPILVLDVV